MAGSLRTKNTILNILLFILGFLLILLFYNLYLSYSSSEEELEEQNTTGRVIQVAVLNGTQTDGLAKKLSDFLKTKNFDVVMHDNYSSKDVKKTFIIDHLGDRNVLRRIIRILKIDPEQVQLDIKKNNLIDLTIVIGEDYQKLNREIKW